MSLLNKKDVEIFKIAEPIWDNLVKSSNMKDYGGFTRDFSSQMLYGANEVELGKQWANNKLLTSLSEKQNVLGCIRRDKFITVLYKQTSNVLPGEFLGRLVLGVEGEESTEGVSLVSHSELAKATMGDVPKTLKTAFLNEGIDIMGGMGFFCLSSTF